MDLSFHIDDHSHQQPRAKPYSRKEIWGGIANLLGEKWAAVEAEVSSFLWGYLLRANRENQFLRQGLYRPENPHEHPFPDPFSVYQPQHQTIASEKLNIPLSHQIRLNNRKQKREPLKRRERRLSRRGSLVKLMA